MTSAGFLSDPKPDIMRWKYKKLLLNLGNAIEAICGPRAAAVSSTSARNVKASPASTRPASRM